MPGWLEFGISTAVGTVAIVLAFRYSHAIGVLIVACLEALGLPIGVLAAWKRKRDSESRIHHHST